MIELTQQELELLKNQENEELLIPNLNNCNPTEEIQPNLKELLQGEIITNTITKKESVLKIPSYLIECSDEPTIHGSWFTLSNILCGGDTAVYVRGLNGRIKELGTADNSVLSRALYSVMKSIFGAEYKLYYNYGKGYKTVKEIDTASFRLRI